MSKPAPPPEEWVYGTTLRDPSDEEVIFIIGRNLDMGDANDRWWYVIEWRQDGASGGPLARSEDMLTTYYTEATE